MGRQGNVPFAILDFECGHLYVEVFRICCNQLHVIVREGGFNLMMNFVDDEEVMRRWGVGLFVEVDVGRYFNTQCQGFTTLIPWNKQDENIRYLKGRN